MALLKKGKKLYEWNGSLSTKLQVGRKGDKWMRRFPLAAPL